MNELVSASSMKIFEAKKVNIIYMYVLLGKNTLIYFSQITIAHVDVNIFV